MAIETTIFLEGAQGVVCRHLSFPNWRVWDKRMSYVSKIARGSYAEITGGRCRRFAYDCPEMGSWVEGSLSSTATAVAKRPDWIPTRPIEPA